MRATGKMDLKMVQENRNKLTNLYLQDFGVREKNMERVRLSVRVKSLMEIIKMV